jgi:membrane protein
MLRCDMETAQRLLLTMEEREWIARLEAATRRRATSCWRTRSSTLAQLFDVLVIDRTELNLQPQRAAPRRRRGAARRAVERSLRRVARVADRRARGRWRAAGRAGVRLARRRGADPHARPPKTA